MTRLLIVISLLCFGLSSRAQQPPDDNPDKEKDGKQANFGNIYGVHTGPLLPNQISGMTEIMPVLGVHYAIPAHKGHLEFGLASANAWGTSYYNGSVSYRTDIRLDDMFGILYGGLDTHYYNPPSSPYNLYFGVHFGGGFAAHVSDQLWFRADMKFNLNPGTSLYVGFGFEWRMPAGEGNQDQGQAAQ